eukprot:jgi/Mesvir1/2214/Mv09858-RA.1
MAWCSQALSPVAVLGPRPCSRGRLAHQHLGARPSACLRHASLLESSRCAVLNSSPLHPEGLDSKPLDARTGGFWGQPLACGPSAPSHLSPLNRRLATVAMGTCPLGMGGDASNSSSSNNNSGAEGSSGGATVWEDKGKVERQRSTRGAYEEGSKLLAERIARGEFTQARPASSKLRVISAYVRDFLSRLGKWGRWLALLMATWERARAYRAARTMPEARGDVREIVGEPHFVPLYRLFLSYGPVFRLSFGPKSFVVVSNPANVKQVLQQSGKVYSKGMLSEIVEFVMGQGLIPADGEHWRLRRRSILPAVHKRFLAAMVGLFGDVTSKACGVLGDAADAGKSVEMEHLFSSLALDVIGAAVFNYKFESLTKRTPVIKAVYNLLLEAEKRSLAIIPYWKIPIIGSLLPSQVRMRKSLEICNQTLDELIADCKAAVEKNDEAFFEEYVNKSDPSILHYLIMSGDQVSSKQLRDDLMTLLIAGHETLAAVMTWTFYMLSLHPEEAAAVQREVDEVLGDRLPTMEDYARLKHVKRVINEGLRLYPQPPVLIRRTLCDTVINGYDVKKGEDIFLSVWNLHRDPNSWERPNEFVPSRWDAEGNPNEVSENYRFLPFGGGPRKCLGDQFAMLEGMVVVSMLLRRFDFRLADDAPAVRMATGATIHTKEGLYMSVRRRIPPTTTTSVNGSDTTHVAADIAHA